MQREVRRTVAKRRPAALIPSSGRAAAPATCPTTTRRATRDGRMRCGWRQVVRGDGREAMPALVEQRTHVGPRTHIGGGRCHDAEPPRARQQMRAKHAAKGLGLARRRRRQRRVAARRLPPQRAAKRLVAQLSLVVSRLLRTLRALRVLPEHVSTQRHRRLVKAASPQQRLRRGEARPMDASPA